MSLRKTELIVDLRAIAHNTRVLREVTGAAVMAVVKSDGYGHGAIPVSRAALSAGAKAIGVAIVEEGLELRESGINAPVLVLAPSSAEGLLEGAKAGLSLCVDTRSDIVELAYVKQRHYIMPRIQIKLDTGMGRVGLRSVEEAVSLFRLAAQHGLSIEGVFTHFSTADVEDGGGYVLEQVERFEHMLKALREAGFSGLVHAANSAASILYPKTRYSMVREGIAMYGSDISGELGLKPALTWKTRVSLVKEIDKGDSVSYGRRYIAGENRVVATLPVGYGDGYRRGMTGKAQALIRGRRVPVLGTICMDQIMIDVSDISDVKAGEEVVLLGRQKDGEITGAEMAAWVDTIDYEIYTGISKRVPRVYIRE